MAENPSLETFEEEGRDHLPLEDLLEIIKCPVCWRRPEPENFFFKYGPTLASFVYFSL